MVVAYKNIHWKVRPFERKGLSKVRPFWKKKRRRPSTKTVVARNNTLKSQSLWKAFQKSDPFERKKGDDHQQRWSSPEIFFEWTLKISAKKNWKKKEQHPPFGERRSGPFSSVFFRRQTKGQIVDQRLTLNESQRRTALTITTPRSSTRSFANDLAPRLSTRGLALTRGDACRAPEGRYIDSVATQRPPSFVCRGRGTNASSLLGGILT